MKLHSNPMLKFNSGIKGNKNSSKPADNGGAGQVKAHGKQGAKGTKGAQAPALGPHDIKLADKSSANVKSMSNNELLQAKTDLENRIAQNDDERDNAFNQAYRKFDSKMDELSDPDKVKSHLADSQSGVKNKMLSPFSGTVSSVVHSTVYNAVSDISNHKFPSAKTHEKLSSMAAKGDVSEYVSLMQKHHHDQIGVDQTKSDKHFSKIGEQLFTDLDKVENEMRERGIG